MGVGKIGNKIYLFGGYASTGKPINTITVFDTETEIVTTLSATLPSVLHNMGVGVIGNEIYLFGGTSLSGTNSVKLKTIVVFNALNNTVKTLSVTLPSACSSMGSATVGTKIYLFGGYTTSRINTIYVFSVAFELATNNLLIQTTLISNLFNIVGGIEIGVASVYLGNSDGNGETVEAYLYQNEAWTHI